MDEEKHLSELVMQDEKLISTFTNEELEEFFKPDFFLRNIGISWKRLGLQDPAENKY